MRFGEKLDIFKHSGAVCEISAGVALAVGAVVSVGSAIAGANAAKQAKNDALGEARKGRYTPDKAAYEDPYAKARRERIDTQFESASAGPAQDFRDRQLGLYDDLGNRPSIAEAQLQQGLDQGQANLLSSAASGGGSGSARDLLNAQQGLAGQTQNTAITARMQEQQQNDALRANLAGQGRAGDIQGYGQQQGATLALLKQQAAEDEAQRAARIKREELIELNRRGVSQSIAGVHTKAGQQQSQVFSNLGKAGASIAGMGVKKLIKD